MKKFTVKDFIDYNAPCFSCGEKISLKFGILDPTTKGYSYLRPTVKADSTTVVLKSSYYNSLELHIFHKTNKIGSNDSKALAEYLQAHQMYIHSHCDKCYTLIQSHFLTFNLNKGFVEPVTISFERLMVMDESNMYSINSSYISEKSAVTVDRIDKARPISPIQFEAPLLPLYKLKTKERLITKLKTYAIFS